MGAPRGQWKVYPKFRFAVFVLPVMMIHSNTTRKKGRAPSEANFPVNTTMICFGQMVVFVLRMIGHALMKEKPRRRKILLLHPWGRWPQKMFSF